jgi:hypothetical protein
MKKIKRTLLLWAMIALGITSTVAQNADCEPCQPGNVRQVVVPLCNSSIFEYDDLIYNPVTNRCDLVRKSESYITILVVLNIREVNCNGIFREYIEDAIYVDNRGYIDNVRESEIIHAHQNGPCANTPLFTNVTITHPSCPDYSPLSPATIKKGIADAIAMYTGNSNTTVSQFKDVIVNGSCYSLVKVEWPAGSFVDMPGGDGQPSKRINIGGSDSYVRVPCSDACCVLKMRRIEVIDGNGFTTYKWTNIGVQQPDNEICESMPIPDFNSYNPKPKASILDPVTGAVIDIEPTFVSQEPCEPLCPTLVQSNGFNKTTFTTDLIEAKEEQIALTASPIPAKNVVTFNSSVEIKAIKVFDNAGRRVYEDAKLINNMLDISGWNNAQYYIQVILENNEVKTLKILKN